MKKIIFLAVCCLVGCFQVYALAGDGNDTYEVNNRATLTIVSQDSFSQKVIKNREMKIRIYDVTRREYIIDNNKEILTIGSAGILKLDNRFNEGEYIIEKIESPFGYENDNSKLNFYISENEERKTIVIYNQPIRYDMIINKKQEKFIGVVDIDGGVKGEYSLENANEGVYGIYADENIYDESGKVLYAVNSLVSELIIENGKTEYNGIPFGNYYVKELSSDNKYEAKQKTIWLSLTGKSDVVYLEFIDYLKKGDITITTLSDEMPLSGVEFIISSDYYLSNKNLTSNAMGMIKIKDVPYDTYYLKETKVPEGYMLNKEEKVIILDNSIYNYQLENEKENITSPPNNSEMPEEPPMPDDSEIEEVPEGPVIPEKPEVEEIPEKPLVPDNPEIEEAPEDPIIPGDSDGEEKPDELIKPEAPIEPESPITPELSDKEEEEIKIPAISDNIRDEMVGGKEEIDESNNDNLDYIVENPSTSVPSHNGLIFNVIIYICIMLELKSNTHKY